MNNLIRLAIETTNICNLKCRMCLHHGPLYRGQSDEHPKTMELDFFKDIVDQFACLNLYPKHVTPHFQGEPLCYRYFIEACEYIEKSGMTQNITTNAMLLTHDISDFIISIPSFINIAFSIDGYSKQVNESIRIGVNHDLVLSNIDYFLDRVASSSRYILVAVNMTRMAENEHEYEKFIRYWIRKDIYVQVSMCTDVEGRSQRMYWNPIGRTPCRALECFMIALTNGDCVPCCRDHQYEMVMGNLHKQTLSEIWNGPEYYWLRKQHEHSLWSEHPLCSRCETWMFEYCGSMYRLRFLDPYIAVKQGPYWEEFTRITHLT